MRGVLWRFVVNLFFILFFVFGFWFQARVIPPGLHTVEPGVEGLFHTFALLSFLGGFGLCDSVLT